MFEYVWVWIGEKQVGERVRRGGESDKTEEGKDEGREVENASERNVQVI